MFSHMQKLLGLVTGVVLFAAPALSLAQKNDPPPTGSIPAGVAELATQVVKFLDGRGESGVEIGQITPIGNSTANGGPGLRAELIESLETQRKGIVKPKAKVAINGKFAPVSDPADQGADKDEQLLAMRVTIEILDKSTGSMLLGADTFIRRLRDIARIEGVTAKLKDAGTREQNNDLKAQIEEPRVFIEAGRARAAKNSPYEVQIGVRSLLKGSRPFPRPLHEENGQPFVDIQKNELYEVVVHNHSDHEIAVGISIDGIDMFTFSEDRNPETGRPAFSNWIVQPGKILVVPGWYKTADPRRNDNYMSFMVTEYGKGASSKLGAPPGELGVITVSIAKSHPKGAAAAKGGAETGFGPPRKGNLRPVERLVDPPHEFISIRYTR